MSLVDRLRTDYPEFKFLAGDVFRWSPTNSAVYYDAEDSSEHANLSLLHELSHGILQHTQFSSDVQLIALERQAWEQCRQLCAHYAIDFLDDHAEECMDSYRTWLYKRSDCPNCHATGLEADKCHYTCFNCAQRWKVPLSQAVLPRRFCLNT